MLRGRDIPESGGGAKLFDGCGEVGCRGLAGRRGLQCNICKKGRCISHEIASDQDRLIIVAARRGLRPADPAARTLYLASQPPSTGTIVDRTRADDAFVARSLHGQGRGFGEVVLLQFELAADCLKYSVPGDFHLASEADVQALMDDVGLGVRPLEYEFNGYARAARGFADRRDRIRRDHPRPRAGAAPGRY